MSDVLHYAFEYLDRGWSLIPLVGKRPPKRFGWKRFQTERATLDDIKRWFSTSKDGFSNIGIVTGAVSEITVVDCDTPADAEWWKQNFPATPLVASTGRGGAHMYYRANQTVRIGNRANILGRNIDIRGDGGYVCAPPSIHPDTKVVYDWQPWDHYSFDEIPLFHEAWIGPTRSPRSLASVGATPADYSGSILNQHDAAVRPTEEVLRDYPRPRQIRRLVSSLNRGKRDRSKRDYAIVCELIRLGLAETDIWSLVHAKSKFATDGWRYFVTTFRSASQDVGASAK